MFLHLSFRKSKKVPTWESKIHVHVFYKLHCIEFSKDTSPLHKAKAFSDCHVHVLVKHHIVAHVGAVSANLYPLS